MIIRSPGLRCLFFFILNSQSMLSHMKDSVFSVSTDAKMKGNFEAELITRLFLYHDCHDNIYNIFPHTTRTYLISLNSILCNWPYLKYGTVWSHKLNMVSKTVIW